MILLFIGYIKSSFVMRMADILYSRDDKERVLNFINCRKIQTKYLFLNWAAYPELKRPLAFPSLKIKGLQHKRGLVRALI